MREEPNISLLSRRPAEAVGVTGGVSAAFPDASRAGVRMLERGGNAVDAACAAAWALSVCEPAESGLGGQTTMLIRLATGACVVVDGHSRGPRGLRRGGVGRAEQLRGIRSMSVPTTVGTLGAAQARYGRLTLAETLEPAVELASEGYAITRLQRRLLRWTLPHWGPGSAEAGHFLKGGAVYGVGEVFRQPALAGALRRLQAAGAGDFYRGSMAREIVADMEARGGLVTMEDLSGAAEPMYREVLEGEYRGYRVLGVPPPGGGVQVLLSLGVLERLTSGDEPEWAWRKGLAAATRCVFRERERWPDHPDDVTRSLAGWLVSGERASVLASRVRSGEEPGGVEDSMGEEGNTTHLCAADRDGCVVSLTQSIQSIFGSKVAHPTLGFAYNNYLSTCPRKAHAYRLGGGCLPQSNASPVLVMTGEGRPVMALGSAGSRRIVSSIVQVVSGVIDRGQSLGEAVSMPRAHALLSGGCWHEKTMDAESVSRLGEGFGPMRARGARGLKLGAVQALMWRGGDGKPGAGGTWGGALEGAADPRRDGAFVGIES